MAFCPNCGKEINENDQYCYNCGNPIKDRQSIIVPENTKRSDEMTQHGASPLKKGGAVAFLIASILYSFVLPVDVVPDGVLIAGWIDDACLLLTSILNMVQVYIQDQNSYTVHIIKLLKWIMFALFVVIVLLFGGLIAFIIFLLNRFG